MFSVCMSVKKKKGERVCHVYGFKFFSLMRKHNSPEPPVILWGVLLKMTKSLFCYSQRYDSIAFSFIFFISSLLRLS